MARSRYRRGRETRASWETDTGFWARSFLASGITQCLCAWGFEGGQRNTMVIWLKILDTRIIIKKNTK